MSHLSKRIIGEEGPARADSASGMSPEKFFSEWGRKGASFIIRRLISEPKSEALTDVANGLAHDLEQMGHYVAPSKSRDNIPWPTEVKDRHPLEDPGVDNDE